MRPIEKDVKMGVKLDVSCLECKKQSTVGAESSQDEAITAHIETMTLSGDGEAVTVTVYQCPYCGARNTLQIDTPDTAKMLKQEIDIMRDATYQKRKGGKVKKNQADKLKAIQRDLAKSRKELINKYNGRILYSSFGLPVEVRYNDAASQ